MLKTSVELDIESYMTDCAYRLRASSFMDLAQVVAMKGSDSLGFGYDILRQQNMAFVLYRMQFKFLRPVKWNEHITFNTWHRGLDGLVFLRDYEIIGQDGKRAAVGTSSWVVLNTFTRSFVWTENLPSCVSLTPQFTEAVMDAPAQKIVIPKGVKMREADTHIVSYSDVDFIGHTNNVKYVQWAMDLIDREFAATHQVKEVTVNYIKETRLGEAVKIMLGEIRKLDSNVFYLEGFANSQLCFSVRLEF